jgi:hypothetical protein
MSYPWQQERPERNPQPYEPEAPYEFTEEEIAALELVRDTNRELREEIEASDRTQAYLEWGRWLVEHGKVSEG